jgi:epoxyqueuosine reductase
MQSAQELKQQLIDVAHDMGFDLCRITRPDAIPQVPDRLAAFLEQGYHGQMAWMAERTQWRGNPAALWPEARSIIMLGESYRPEHDPRDILNHPDKGAISVYAQNKDYHDSVKTQTLGAVVD